MKQSDWISVKDRLPDNDDDVLVTDGKRLEIAFWFYYFEPHCWSFSNELAGYDTGAITHWMPLPPLPEGK
jgi:hypothetical protein